MPIPPWGVELLRRSIAEVSTRANPEQIEKLKDQAREIFRELPAAAARGVEGVLQAAEPAKESVRSWAKQYTAASWGRLNATGRIAIDAATPAPAADVLAAGLELIDGSRRLGPGVDGDARDAIDRIGGSGWGLFVTQRFESAVALIPELADGRTITLHRASAERIGPIGGVADVLHRVGASVREVGTIEGVEFNDYESSGPYAAVTAGGVDGGLPGDVLRIDVLPAAAWKTSFAGLPTVGGSIAGGADVVIVRAGALVGGPGTGVVLAKRETVERLHRSTGPLYAADDARVAMTVAALRRDPGEDPGSIASLVGVGEDNLRGRAERLVARLGGSERVADARMTDRPAVIAGRYEVPSRQVLFRCVGEDADGVRRRLHSHDPSIETRTDFDDPEVALDLRFVPPGEDALLAEAIG